MEYLLDKKQSSITWTAYQPENRIEGKVHFIQGKVKAIEGLITGGYAQADLKNLKVTSSKLSPDKQHELETHLKSKDFFDINAYPSAVFELLDVKTSSGITTHIISGELTIKGIKHHLDIPVNVVMDKQKIDVKAKFSVIRTKFNIHFMIEESFGSKKILPEFDLDIHIVAIA